MIRKAEEKDAPRVLELLREIAALHHAGRPDIFSGADPKYDEAALCEKFGRENERIFVSVDENDRVNGYVMCVLQEKDDPFYTQRPYRTLYVDDLCVDKAARRRGVGRALMDRAVEEARARVLPPRPERLGVQRGRHPLLRVHRDAEGAAVYGNYFRR